jgi:hypothetical protein
VERGKRTLPGAGLPNNAVLLHSFHDGG